MKETIRGIVLGTVKHSDKHDVTNVFTRERGRMAFLTPAGTSKRSRQNAARLLPLSVVEMQVNVSATRELHIPSAITPIRIWRTIYFDPVKSTVAMMLSEFLQRLLRESPPETILWDYMAGAVALFDATTDRTAIANFHITFLVSLMPMMGIQPDLDNYVEGMEFDMKAGTMKLPFSALDARGARIDARKSAFVPVLARISFANSGRFHFNGEERSQVLDFILRYYGFHFPGCDNLKSLDIMREIFR